MINGKPLFMGTSETDQLKKIFKIRGTPNEQNYPGIKDLNDWINNENNFEVYREEDIRKFVPKMDADGVDLLLVLNIFNLQKMLQMDPEKRISADEALKHPYFDDIQSVIKEIYKQNIYNQAFSFSRIL